MMTDFTDKQAIAFWDSSTRFCLFPVESFADVAQQKYPKYGIQRKNCLEKIPFYTSFLLVHEHNEKSQKN